MRKFRNVYGTFIIIWAVFFLPVQSLAFRNQFLREHVDECEKVERYYYFDANSNDGRLLVNAKAPDSDSRKYRRETHNNQIFWIQYIYDYNGEFWGYTELIVPGTLIGWVYMNQLLPVYDYNSFHEEHEDEFYPYTGSYEEFKKVKRVIPWTWPGSGVVRGRERTAKEIEDAGISYAYKDKEGREWGLIAGSQVLHYGRFYNGVWICISDPANRAMPAFDPPRPLLARDTIYETGNRIFISDVTEENESLIGFTSKFRPIKSISGYILGVPIYRPQRSVPYCESSHELWRALNTELSDAANPERIKIPYAFAFDLTMEEHALCEAKPDEVLSIIQEKEAVLTWPSPEVQWGDKLRVRYLRDYIKLLKENGYVEWAETIENFEGKDYLDDEYQTRR